MAQPKKAKGKGSAKRIARCAGCQGDVDMDSGDWAVFLKDNKHYTAHWGGQHGCDCVHAVYHPEEAL